ncbi:MAG: hypothetical protein OXN17_08165 [Candidatus Poribacteria bacterium]|nr:hypothetical protein [Candidatus Poribacteria bacterium]MDE0503276.1 hypothetical protein [Candidatus Poribacteria bacterium]
MHQSKDYLIAFAKRGKSDQTGALRRAIELARTQFSKRHDFLNQSNLKVIETTPAEEAGLQVVDYFTWSLQRLYERGEERSVRYLWNAFRFVQDIHDRRKAG